MITREEAYELVKGKYKDLSFDGICVDYKDSWAFPYSIEDDMPTSERIFVSKENGMMLENDPAFNLTMWVNANSYDMNH